MTSRETIYSALFALIQPLLTASTIKTASRIALNWDKTDPEDQPALYQIELGENVVTGNGVPNIYTLNCEWYVYVNPTGDPTELHSTPINNILDSLEAVLVPPAGQENQTLGGLVPRIFVGQREIHEGLLGSQVIGILPISIIFMPAYSAGGC